MRSTKPYDDLHTSEIIQSPSPTTLRQTLSEFKVIQDYNQNFIVCLQEQINNSFDIIVIPDDGPYYVENNITGY